MNKIIITGRLGGDPQLKTSGSGNEYTNFSVAVDRRKDKDKERKADWFYCAAFGKLAVFITTYFKKGDPIIVFGKMTVSKWEKDGKTQTSVEVTVRQIEFPMSKKTEKYEDPSEAFRAAAEEEGELPY